MRGWCWEHAHRCWSLCANRALEVVLNRAQEGIPLSLSCFLYGGQKQMPEVQLYLFGTPRLVFDGSVVKIQRRKALALAAYLALAEHPQNRAVVAALFWPDLDHEHALAALRSTLRHLTESIPLKWLISERTSLALNRDLTWVDVHAFLELLSQTGTHGHAADATCARCVEQYQQAGSLYRADFMAGFPVTASVEYDDWHLLQQEWLRRECAELQKRLSDYYAENGNYDLALRHAHQWLAVNPLHEPAHRHLIRLYAVNGQRAEAIHQYERCVALLDAELATPPDAETQRLYTTIQDGSLPMPRIEQEEPIESPLSVMPPMPSLVIGREEALRQIKWRLGIGSRETRAITVIQGWPGVGKSTTAATLSHDSEVTNQFTDGILWTSLGEIPNIAGELSAWADALRIPASGRKRTVEETSALLTASLRHKRMLLIVDDVWHPEHAQPFRVGGQHCALLMTSRLNDVAIALAPTAGDIYRLPVLEDVPALDLLAKLTPETVAEYPDEARELVRDLEGLPLAIHIAGRLLHSEAHFGWGIRELLEELRTGSSLLQAQLPSDLIGAEHSTTSTLAALLKRSTDLLDPETRRQFAYLGLFVPKPATFDLKAMAAAWNVSDARPTARRLINRGLVEPISGGRFQMHAVLVFHARSLLEAEEAL